MSVSIGDYGYNRDSLYLRDDQYADFDDERNGRGH
jgi:hypothetical protein